MIVFKATNNDMTCKPGQGIQYQLGVPATAERSQCASTGLHACEYVLDCTWYYGLGAGNRYFKAKAEGDIAEDGQLQDRTQNIFHLIHPLAAEIP